MHRPYRILIVGERAESCRYLEDILERHAFEVRRESRLGDALGTLESFAPELLLLDTYGAQLGGRELLQWMRAEGRHLGMPLIFLISESGVQAQRTMMGMGGSGRLFLTRPVDADYLVDLVTAQAEDYRRMQGMHQALQRSLTELDQQRQALDAHAVVSITDAEGRITYANDRFCKVSGYHAEELMGQTHQLLKSGAHPAGFYHQMWQTILAGQIWQGEICNRTRGGRLVWMSSTIMPFLGNDGRPYQYISIRTDITEQKLQQQRLAESEARFRRVADSTPVMIWMSGLDKGCNYFNKTWLTFTGRTMEQELGEGWLDRVHPEDRPACRQAYETAFDGRHEFDIEYRLLRHDGEYRWLLDHGQPRHGAEGVFEGYIGSCTDITEHVLARRQLQETGERLIYALEGTGQGVWDWDFAAQKVFYSPQWKSMLGFAEEECPEAELWVAEHIHPEDLSCCRADCERHLRGETRIFENEHRALRRDGSTLWLLSRGKVVQWDAEGRPLRMVGTDTDITQRKLAESQLQRMRELAVQIQRIQVRFIEGEDRACIVRACLEVALAFTASDAGFIAHLGEGADGRFDWQLRAAMARGAALPEEAPILDWLAAGVTETMADNAFLNVPLPAAMAEALGFDGDGMLCGLPILKGREPVGIVAVVRQAGAYERALAADLQPLLAAYVSIEGAMQAEQRRMWAETRLQRLNQELEARVEERTWEMVESYNQLQESERFQRALFEIAPVGLALFRAADGVLVDCNPAFARMLDWPMESLVGRCYWELVHASTPEREAERFRQWVREGMLAASEEAYRTPKGEPVAIRQSGRRVERKGEPLIWLVAEDIRDEQRREAVTDHLTHKLATLTGQGLFDAMCQSLSELLQSEQVFILRVLPDREKLGILAWLKDETWIPQQDFDYRETLFEEVMGVRQVVSYTHVPLLFPDKPWLREHRIESCAMLALVGFDGEVIGVLGAMSQTPFPLPQPELVSILNLFAVRATAEIQRLSAEQRFQDLFHFSPDAIVLADGQGQVRQANASASSLFGYPPSELIGLSVDQLVPEEARALHGENRQRYMAQVMPHVMAVDRQSSVRGRRRDGRVMPLEISLVPVDTGQGRWVAAVIRDISERMEAQQKIQASLREKETLLKEIHHRVKNNLQIIVSLLNMQSDRMEAGPGREALLESQHRVRSMALIHERLYRNDDLGGVDFGEYLYSLATALHRAYQHGGCVIRLEMNLDPVRLNIDTAIPCGLIVNEMVTNAFKHAFIGREQGCLRLSLKVESEEIVLGVTDDGPGLPPAFDWQKSDSLGTLLIQTLTKQIKARLEVGKGPGTAYTLRFKELNYAPR